MKGFKVFNNDWTCKGFQFEVGKVFEQDVKPVCCKSGFHFCKKVSDCFNYYEFDSKNRVAEIEALGDIDAENENRKYCTNKIRIVRELTWYELLDMVNTGSGNVGFGNTGSNNSGDCNSGYDNSGDWNAGDFNTGNGNTGDNNSGNRNTGRYNSGNYNTGNHNIGDFNCGELNTGNWNTGECNRGNYNCGRYNFGNHNTGDWNTGHHNTGCFNTETPKINMFDKPSNWTLWDWEKSNARTILRKMYRLSDKQAWWDNLSNQDKEVIMNLPNFDKYIFEKITGIVIEDETEI